MENNQVKTSTIQSQNLMKHRIYHPQLISKQNHLTHTINIRTNKINKNPIIPTQKTNQIFMTMIIILTPEDTPMTNISSAHNHERIIDFSLLKKT